MSIFYRRSDNPLHPVVEHQRSATRHQVTVQLNETKTATADADEKAQKLAAAKKGQSD